MADRPTREPDLCLELVSQARYLAAVRTMVGAVAQRLGFDDIQSGQISLAVDEALCNIIKHGYDNAKDGRIWVRLWADETGATEGGLHIVIDDEARQIEVADIRSRDLDDVRPGGLGVFIIREVMDDVAYAKRQGGGMRLSLFKRLDPSAATPSAYGAVARGPGEGR